MAEKKKKQKKEIPQDAGVSMESDSIKEQAARQAHMQSQVPPPMFIRETLSEAQKKPEPKPEDDEIIAEGAKSDFWKLIKGFIEVKQEHLSDNTKEQIASGNLTLEMIGIKSLWKDLIVDFGQDIINFVENRAKLVEQIRIEKQKAEAERARNEQNNTSESQ